MVITLERADDATLTNIVYRFVGDDEAAFEWPHYAPDFLLREIASCVFIDQSGRRIALCTDLSGRGNGFGWTVLRYTPGGGLERFWSISWRPDGFADHLAGLGSDYAMRQVVTAEGRLAFACLDRFQSWALSERARQAIELIEAGGATFDSIRERVPEVFDVPLFKNYVAARVASGQMPKGRKGKRPSSATEPAKRELYLHACAFEQKEPGITWSAACAAALVEAPELARTARWHVGDEPWDNLRRTASARFSNTRWAAYRRPQTDK
ncbi:hypothetical protein [Pseudomonas sp. Gutcm_11s]|uniref:hypothetical protein n=1 Tax=Pseudomonas sp. Gutcm_11s TaxID=3026088 RepID=UPI00235EACC9|nr:hypothetical protein [Pseudomonas sp. Gutcm_11s]MDD0843362.1 hypothetical protein [Pseudomonas sp. Gutcm_11s]